MKPAALWIHRAVFGMHFFKASPEVVNQRAGTMSDYIRGRFLSVHGKSETASLSGLELRLHAECDPQNEMPVFNPSSYSASSLSPCGNCGCY